MALADETETYVQKSISKYVDIVFSAVNSISLNKRKIYSPIPKGVSLGNIVR